MGVDAAECPLLLGPGRALPGPLSPSAQCRAFCQSLPRLIAVTVKAEEMWDKEPGTQLLAFLCLDTRRVPHLDGPTPWSPAQLLDLARWDLVTPPTLS